TGVSMGWAWLPVSSDERAGGAKPQASGESSSRQAESGKDEAAKDDRNEEAEDPVKAIVSGKVVTLGEALKQRGIKSYAEEIRGQVVLVTRAGEIVPIVPDWRGRGAFSDGPT